MLPVTSDNSLLADCHRKGEIGATRTGWISNNWEISHDKANQRGFAVALGSVDSSGMSKVVKTTKYPAGTEMLWVWDEKCYWFSFVRTI